MSGRTWLLGSRGVKEELGQVNCAEPGRRCGDGVSRELVGVAVAGRCVVTAITRLQRGRSVHSDDRASGIGAGEGAFFSKRLRMCRTRQNRPAYERHNHEPARRADAENKRQ